MTQHRFQLLVQIEQELNAFFSRFPKIQKMLKKPSFGGLERLAGQIASSNFVDHDLLDMSDADYAKALFLCREYMMFSSYEEDDIEGIKVELQAAYADKYENQTKEGYENLTFGDMVEMFAEDSFYYLHYAARLYLSVNPMEDYPMSTQNRLRRFQRNLKRSRAIYQLMVQPTFCGTRNADKQAEFEQMEPWLRKEADALYDLGIVNAFQ